MGVVDGEEINSPAIISQWKVTAAFTNILNYAVFYPYGTTYLHSGQLRFF